MHNYLTLVACSLASYNPGATVSTTIAAKILSSLRWARPAPTGRPRLAILDISVWVDNFATMATVLGSVLSWKSARVVRLHGSHRPAHIVDLLQPYLPKRGLGTSDLLWSVPNPRLFQEHAYGLETTNVFCSTFIIMNECPGDITACGALEVWEAAGVGCDVSGHLAPSYATIERALWLSTTILRPYKYRNYID